MSVVAILWRFLVSLTCNFHVNSASYPEWDRKMITNQNVVTYAVAGELWQVWFIMDERLGVR